MVIITPSPPKKYRRILISHFSHEKTRKKIYYYNVYTYDAKQKREKGRNHYHPTAAKGGNRMGQNGNHIRDIDQNAHKRTSRRRRGRHDALNPYKASSRLDGAAGDGDIIKSRSMVERFSKSKVRDARAAW